MGTTHYTYDGDGNLTTITSPDGAITLTNTGPAPTQMQWVPAERAACPAVAGSVQLQRNPLFQVQKLTVGGVHRAHRRCGRRADACRRD